MKQKQNKYTCIFKPQYNLPYWVMNERGIVISVFRTIKQAKYAVAVGNYFLRKSKIQ